MHKEISLTLTALLCAVLNLIDMLRHSWLLIPAFILLFCTSCSSGSAVSVPEPEILLPPGNALLFDGINDYITIDRVPEDPAFTEFTIECWIYLDEETQVADSAFSTTLIQVHTFTLSWKKPAALRSIIKVDGESFHAFFGRFKTGTWYHIAAVYDGYSLKAYKNGRLTEENNGMNPAPETGFIAMDEDTRPFLIGKGHDTVTLFKGIIDELRIWTSVRNQSKILNTMCRPVAFNEQGLHAYYNFDHTGGSTLTDHAGSSDGMIFHISDNQWIVSDIPFNTSVVTINDIFPVKNDAIVITGFAGAPSGTTISSKGICWNTGGNPTLADNLTDEGSGIGEYLSSMTGHMPDTVYFMKPYLMTDTDIIYGDEISFTAPINEFGYALEFNGNDDRVDLPNAVLNGMNQITTEFWITSTFDGTQYMLSGASHDINNEFNIYTENNTSLSVCFNGSKVVWDISSHTIADGSRHHVAVTGDMPAGWAIVYVDGISFGTKSITTGTLDIGFLMLGQDQDCFAGCLDPDQAFSGKMDELRIWNTIRSQTEIQENMFIQPTGSETWLMAYYSFDHVSGTTLYDLSPNFHDGAVINTPQWIPSDIPVP